jgi:uroporphyrinogen-III synthase
VTFTSASTVRFFAGAFAEHDLSSVRGVSIGPITSSAMRELGIPIVAEAANHDLDGLVAAIVEAAGNR